MRKVWRVLLVLLLFGLGPAIWLLTVSAQAASSVSGIVVDANGPLAGTTVRLRATEIKTTTDAEGRFTLAPIADGIEAEITAWRDGYYIASTHITPPTSEITLTLRPYHQQDHPDYNWVSPVPGSSPGACGDCHPMILPQWKKNAHGQAISNPRFFSLYNGTNLSGSEQVGAGYQKDFPDTSGTCANCHAPGAAVDGYLTTNMNDHRDVVTSGIHCDYCHKVGGVYIDPATESVYPNSPGVQGHRVLRPPAGDDIFFGPFDDIKDPDTFLPVFDESQYCATCHQFSFWGTPIYESYNEWLASPYAEVGVTCQTCHMHPNGDSYFASPDVGGVEHPPESIPSHLQPGASDVDLLQNSVTMELQIQQNIDTLEVTVTITNTGAGHHIPTDFPGRQMILLITAFDEEKRSLSQRSGPTIPNWGGAQAGLPGTAFAKLLRDVETGDMPVVSYWKQVVIAEDNRIPASGSDSTTVTFALPPSVSVVEITAQLLFRRIFQNVADAKEWGVDDVEMETRLEQVTLHPRFPSYLPLVANSLR